MIDHKLARTCVFQTRLSNLFCRVSPFKFRTFAALILVMKREREDFTFQHDPC